MNGSPGAMTVSSGMVTSIGFPAPAWSHPGAEVAGGLVGWLIVAVTAKVAVGVAGLVAV